MCRLEHTMDVDRVSLWNRYPTDNMARHNVVLAVHQATFVMSLPGVWCNLLGFACVCDLYAKTTFALFFQSTYADNEII